MRALNHSQYVFLKDSPSRKTYIAELHRYLARVENIIQEPSSAIPANRVDTIETQSFINSRVDLRNQKYPFRFDMSDQQCIDADDSVLQLSPESSFMHFSTSGHGNTIYESYETPKLTNSLPATSSVQTPPQNTYWVQANPSRNSHTLWSSENRVQSACDEDLDFAHYLSSQRHHCLTPSTISSASPAPSTSYRSMNSASPYSQNPSFSHDSPRYMWQPGSSQMSSVSPTCGSPEVHPPCLDDITQSDDENHKLPYNELLFQCLMESEDKALTLQEIYDWFIRRTGKRWSSSQKGWQNSVRHNLSQNEAFVKGSRNSRGKAKKTMWCLSDVAIAERKVYPTTRFRKNTDRPNRSGGSPAPQRQISGAKGGHAARRSARLKHRRNTNAKGYKNELSSASAKVDSRSTISMQNSTPTLPTFDITLSYDTEQSQQNGAISRPYFNGPSTSVVPTLYLENEPQQCTTGYQDSGEFLPQLDVYMGHAELHDFAGASDRQPLPDYFQTSSFSRDIVANLWSQPCNNYATQARSMRQQALHRQAMQRQAMQQDTLRQQALQRQTMQQESTERQSMGLSMEYDLGMGMAAIPTSNTTAWNIETSSSSQRYAEGVFSNVFTRYDTPLLDMQIETDFEQACQHLPANGEVVHDLNDGQNKCLVGRRSLECDDNWGQEFFQSE